mmetsp:Transcript_1012/g.2535  ORF Transcript_1012/g.2535 Transcript_1012/m.2535 type:complete len:444 (-) Transcript_1012:180-1511(-)
MGLPRQTWRRAGRLAALWVGCVPSRCYAAAGAALTGLDYRSPEANATSEEERRLNMPLPNEIPDFGTGNEPRSISVEEIVYGTLIMEGNMPDSLTGGPLESVVTKILSNIGMVDMILTGSQVSGWSQQRTAQYDYMMLPNSGDAYYAMINIIEATNGRQATILDTVRQDLVRMSLPVNSEWTLRTVGPIMELRVVKRPASFGQALTTPSSTTARVTFPAVESSAAASTTAATASMAPPASSAAPTEPTSTAPATTSAMAGATAAPTETTTAAPAPQTSVSFRTVAREPATTAEPADEATGPGLPIWLMITIALAGLLALSLVVFAHILYTGVESSGSVAVAKPKVYSTTGPAGRRRSWDFVVDRMNSANLGFPLGFKSSRVAPCMGDWASYPTTEPPPPPPLVQFTTSLRRSRSAGLSLEEGTSDAAVEDRWSPRSAPADVTS